MGLFPKINLKELEEEVKRNRRERRAFVKKYARWLKKTPNKVWSRQQNKLLDR